MVTRPHGTAGGLTWACQVRAQSGGNVDTLSCPGPQPPSVRGCSTLGSCWGTGTVQTTHLAVTCPCPSRLRRHLACVPTALPPRCSLVWFWKSPRLPWGVPCPGHPAGGAEQCSTAWIQICFCTHSSARSFTLPVPQCPRSTEMARVLPSRVVRTKFFGKAVKPWDGTEQVLLTSLLLRLTITTNICITYLCYARTSRKMTLVSKVSDNGFTPSTLRTAGCPPGTEGCTEVSPQAEPGLARSTWVKHRNPLDGQQSHGLSAAQAAAVPGGGCQEGKDGLAWGVGPDQESQGSPRCPCAPRPGCTRRRQATQERCSDLRHRVPLMLLLLKDLPFFLNTSSFLEHKNAVALLLI
ncbi:uncharacterized protein LOC109502951 [Felis catus]|uniref:uncharacterized protein LOC109502951 n=1 Tax=Felis catus TaxID=9685 RepID=UPI001D198E8F|nr:uncharacterized protein LOC109502951 [Felis catus]